MSLKPFADDVASLSLGEFTVENGTDRLSVSGNMEITRDKAGLSRALKLKAVVDEAVATMRSDPALPDSVGPAKAVAPVQVPNPLA